jgi:hypothetical protein
MDTKNGGEFSKRVVLAGALSLAATAAGLAHAQENLPTMEHGTEMDNPNTKYPKPPFPSQSHPWPGLASKMTPRPDHGEAS